MNQATHKTENKVNGPHPLINKQEETELLEQSAQAKTPASLPSQPPVDPHNLSAQQIVHLQRTIGNQGVQRMIHQGRMRPTPTLIRRSSLPTRSAVIQREAAPVGTFSPSAGITVDRTEQSFVITGNLEIFGQEATPAMASTIEQTIERIWTQTFPDGFSVRCDVTVSHRPDGQDASGSATQIEIGRPAGPSHVTTGIFGGRSMVLNINDSNALTWVVAHEFGHVLGLQDRYTESIFSSIAGTFGGTRTTTVNPGYEGNIMAVDNGTMSSQNVSDLGSENAPGWTTDDDQIRDWVSRHGAAEISTLSGTAKIQMINTLMSGWISEEDVVAMETILRHVPDAIQGDQIRRAIEPELTSMWSIGQRTRVRAALSQMP